MESTEKTNKILVDKEGLIISEKLTQLEDYSDEVTEILSRPPAWIVKYGMTIFLITFLTIFAGTFFIQYPDIRKGEVIVSDVVENDNNNPAGKYIILVKMHSLEGISSGEPINLKIDDFFNHSSAQFSGTIKSAIFDSHQQIYNLEITLPLLETNTSKKNHITQGSKGIGQISVGQQSLFKKIMKKLSLL